MEHERCILYGRHGESRVSLKSGTAHNVKSRATFWRLGALAKFLVVPLPPVIRRPKVQKLVFHYGVKLRRANRTSYIHIRVDSRLTKDQVSYIKIKPNRTLLKKNLIAQKLSTVIKLIIIKLFYLVILPKASNRSLQRSLDAGERRAVLQSVRDEALSRGQFVLILDAWPSSSSRVGSK